MVESGVKRSAAVLTLLEQPAATLGVLNILAILAHAGAALGASALILDPAVTEPIARVGIALAALVATIVAQTSGRTIASARPERTAVFIHQPLDLVARLFAPLFWPFTLLERRGLAILGIARPNDPHAAEEQLRQLLEASESDGVLEQEEREMIHGIFELSQLPVREIMVPRVYVTGVESGATVGDALDLIIPSGHSRLPMYEGSIDNVVGVVYAKDILKHLKTGSLGDPLRPIAREAYFVPEAKKVDELLQELLQRQVHIAIVVDEYGGTAGLITIEDLIEEIVGEIRDEYDVAEEAAFERISDNEAIVDARTTIREINDLFSLNLPDDEFDTLGGLVYQHIGHVPTEGDEVRVDGCTIRVTATQGRRIKKVRLQLGEPDDA